MQDLQIVALLVTEHKDLARERVGIQHLGNLCDQTIKAVAHAHRTAGQVNLGARSNLDHDLAFKTVSTRCKARWLTKPSTRNRVPSARSISIRPTRLSTSARTSAAGRSGGLATAGPAISAGPPSGAQANTPIGMKPLSDGADIGSGCARSADTIVPVQTEDLARAVLRQLNRRFAFIPWRRAISATEAPGQSVSATILRFSSSDHDRRRRFAAAVGEPGTPRAVLNGTGPTITCDNVHQHANGHQPDLIRQQRLSQDIGRPGRRPWADAYDQAGDYPLPQALRRSVESRTGAV